MLNSLENIEGVTLDEYFYSSASSSGTLENFRMENLNKLTLAAENCFENFPRSKITEIRNVDVKVSRFNNNKRGLQTFTFFYVQEIPSRGIKLSGETVIIENSSFTNIRRAGLFVDATNFLFLNNSVDSVATHGFTGNNNLFNFSLNTINSIQDEPFQISPLTLEISRNSFNDVTGQYNQSSHTLYINLSSQSILFSGSPFLSVLPTSACVPESLDSGQ